MTEVLSPPAAPRPADEEPRAASPGSDGLAPSPGRFASFATADADGQFSLHLMVDGAHCGGCVRKIERALGGFGDVTHARLNLTTKRLVVRWDGLQDRADTLADTVEGLGFRVIPFDPAKIDRGDAEEEKKLLRAMAVAGFAAANVMLLSVSVWAGHAQGMGQATRDLLHWFSALIALPAILYAGRPFFHSAWAALSKRHTNMDVPISLAVLLAGGVSLWETMRSGPHAYFDSAVMLLFFLLIGRFLDRRARGRARAAAERLLSLGADAVTVLDETGRQQHVRIDQARPGMTAFVAAGQRIAVDGRVIEGRSDVDLSLISGETVPEPVGPGDSVFAGTLNQTGPISLSITAVGDDTLLGEIVRLMELAEQRRARFITLADRIARHYAPVVHALALLTFLGWTLLVGIAWQEALMIAVAVLIITCPCAIGLAVPAVQVIASGRLMRQGILLKTATALERLVDIDTVVFDKTGTLTTGRLALVDPPADDKAMADAAKIARASRHPLARALAAAAPEGPSASGVVEVPGCGLEWNSPAGVVRLGSRAWCGVADDDAGSEGPELWLARPDYQPARFQFRDTPRPDAAEVVRRLKHQGMSVEILSGDREASVGAIARMLGIESWRSAIRPADKTAHLESLVQGGRTVLMVGDGLNDAPALAAATVSMSPATAADITQTTADAVFQGERLHPVTEVLTVARRADRLVKQNFALAFGYNMLAVPLAVAGLVTPLIAAVAMSASSILVVGNALRLAAARQR